MLDEPIKAADCVDLGEVAAATKGATFGQLDLGAGERMPSDGLTDDL